MMDYEVINILDMIESVGEDTVNAVLSKFSCSRNKEIENFVQNNAVIFAKKKMSITYLVYIDTELSRALNIGVDSAMLDEYRIDHISMIDLTVAQNEFNSYLHTEMQLNSSNERYEGGKFRYKLIINNTVLANNPVVFEVSGVLRTKPVLLSGLCPVNIDIPFKVKARNQRYE